MLTNVLKGLHHLVSHEALTSEMAFHLITCEVGIEPPLVILYYIHISHFFLRALPALLNAMATACF